MDTVRIRKLVDTSHPTRHDLDVLEVLAVERKSPEQLYQTQCATLKVEKVTNRFYDYYEKLSRRAESAPRENNKSVHAYLSHRNYTPSPSAC